jgi:hypothetical protein
MRVSLSRTKSLSTPDMIIHPYRIGGALLEYGHVPRRGDNMPPRQLVIQKQGVLVSRLGVSVDRECLWTEMLSILA